MLDAYEERAKAEVEAWFERPPSTLDKIGDTLSGAIGKPLELAFATPPGRAAMRPVETVYKTGLQGVAKTVQLDKIIGSYREQAPALRALQGVRQLSLEVPDLATSSFGAKYVATGAATGAASGGAALFPGVGTVVAVSLIAADVAALSVVGMRMVCHYAAHYGYDPTSPEEQVFIKGVMALAGSKDPTQRVLIAVELNKIAIDLGRRATWAELRKRQTVRLIETVFEKLGQRLVKRTLAKIVPAVGVVAGAGLNAMYLSDLDDAARMSYRRRVLQEKESRSPDQASE